MSPATDRTEGPAGKAGGAPDEFVDIEFADIEFADIAQLSYEQARDELATIVSGLESGQVPLEESMALWRRGEALAAHCNAWLDGAQRQIAQIAGASEGAEVSERRRA